MMQSLPFFLSMNADDGWDRRRKPAPAAPPLPTLEEMFLISHGEGNGATMTGWTGGPMKNVPARSQEDHHEKGCGEKVRDCVSTYLCLSHSTCAICTWVACCPSMDDCMNGV